MKIKPRRTTKAIIIECWDCGIEEHTHYLESDARICINTREVIRTKEMPKEELVPIVNALPEAGYLRIGQILGTKTTPALIPVGRSTWWDGVKKGRFPAPVKLGPRITAWKVDEIREYIRKAGNGENWSD